MSAPPSWPARQCTAIWPRQPVDSARRPLVLTAAATALAAFGATQDTPVLADTVFLHGKVYANDDVRQAFAVDLPIGAQVTTNGGTWLDRSSPFPVLDATSMAVVLTRSRAPAAKLRANT